MRVRNTINGYKIIWVLSGWVKVFLISNGKCNIMIDTGPEFMWKTLQRRVEKLRVRQIDLLILTHSHFDHAGNAQKIKERYNAKVIIHRSEAEYLLTGDNIPPIGTNPVIKYIIGVFARRLDSFAKYQPCEPDYTFEDFYDLSNLGFNAYLLHTPGHTPGSVSLIIDNESAIAGDAMFGIFCRTVFPLFASDKNQVIDSWEKLLNTKCKIFFPSHGSANKRSLVEKDFKKRKPSEKNK